MILVLCHQTNCSLFLFLLNQTRCTVDKGGRIMDLCSLILIHVPITIPLITSIFTSSHASEYVFHPFICLIHTNYRAVLVTPNFCFPNYVCHSCLTMEKESRWISAFIITPISPWALIKSQPVWCSFFLLLFQNTTPLRVLIRRGRSIRWH